MPLPCLAALLLLAPLAGGQQETSPAAPPSSAAAPQEAGMAGAAPTGDAALTDLDHEVAAVLDQVVESGPLVFHVEAGGLPPGALEEAIAANRAAYDELQQRLGFPLEGRVHLFLYRDKEQMLRLTKIDTIAFATGTHSLHQVHDFRGLHELAHLFALQLPSDETGFTDAFVVEGFATGLTEEESGAPLHAWCATYGRVGRLPALWEVRRRFPEGAPEGVHPYHVAGSFLRFVLERYGMERTLSFYVDALEAEARLGRGFVALERDWWQMLSTLDVAPEHERLVLKRLAPRLAPLPPPWTRAGAELLGPDPLSAWTPDDDSVWTLEDGLLVGRRTGEFSALRRPFPTPLTERGVALRLRFRPLGSAVKLGVRSADGRELQAIFAPSGTWLSSGLGYAGNDSLVAGPGFVSEATLVVFPGRRMLALHGLLLFDLGEAFQPAELELAVENGAVELHGLQLVEP